MIWALTVFRHARKANILRIKLEKYLKHGKLNYKKTKNKIESQKRVLEMARAIGASVGYEGGVVGCIS